MLIKEFSEQLGISKFFVIFVKKTWLSHSFSSLSNNILELASSSELKSSIRNMQFFPTWCFKGTPEKVSLHKLIILIVL